MDDWIFIKPNEEYSKGLYLNRWDKTYKFEPPIRGLAKLNSPKEINDHLNALALGMLKAKKKQNV